MANFKYHSQEDKNALQSRALRLKPTCANVVATEHGWARARPKGTLELLVSFKGLDALLGDLTPELVGEPLTLTLEPVAEVTTPAPTPAVDETPVEIVQEANPSIPVTPEEDDEEEPEPVILKKKPGRPAKVTTPVNAEE